MVGRPRIRLLNTGAAPLFLDTHRERRGNEKEAEEGMYVNLHIEHHSSAVNSGEFSSQLVQAQDKTFGPILQEFCQ